MSVGRLDHPLKFSHEIVLVVVLVSVLEFGLYLPKKTEDENDDEDDVSSSLVLYRGMGGS